MINNTDAFFNTIYKYNKYIILKLLIYIIINSDSLSD